MKSHKRFEEKARIAAEKHFKVLLPNGGVHINGKCKNFDLVNLDKKYVGDVKHYSYTKMGNRPAAKFSTANEYVWLLQKLGEGFKKFLIMGEDEKLVHRYVLEFKPWLEDVGVYFYKSGAKLKKIL